MTLVQLKHLMALAQTGSFSKAAALSFLTQPALSRSIRSLEDELGVPLFDRVGRHAELTPVGAEMAARARQLLCDADDLHDSAKYMTAGLVGRLRVGMGSGPGAMLMTPLLVHMAQEHPAMHVEVARGNLDLLTQALRARTLDALVVDARSLKPAPDLQTSEVSEVRGAFMCRPEHPLMQSTAPVRFEDMRRYPMASSPLGDEVARALTERYGPQADPQLFITLRCDEIAALVDVARQTDTILLAICVAAPGLVEVNLVPHWAGTARYALVTLRRRTEAPGIAILRQLMRKLLPG